jgi:hypothetical protein
MTRKRRTRSPRPAPTEDSDPAMPVLDKPPAERTPKEIKEAMEHDAWLERQDEPER